LARITEASTAPAQAALERKRPPNFWWPKSQHSELITRPSLEDAAHNSNHRIAIGVFDRRQKLASSVGIELDHLEGRDQSSFLPC
jgi:hypothetical protein